MGSQVITINHVVNGESENSRHCRNACDGTTVKPCCEEETSGAASDNINLNVDNADKEMTFRDIIIKENAYMDDDEDDSDWEPLPWKRTVEIPKWFCTNCTMSNLDYAVHCGICGEHRNSGILTKGFYASPLLEDGVESELPERNSVTCPKNSSMSCSTVVGFDERMLLHSEVMMKSHPHPERPDRIRAIAASLASAGIFPGRCHAIPSREITPEELLKVHSMEHVDSVEITSQMFSSYFTPDTYANEHSARAARLAAGLCADLASEIVAGRAKNGFALVRPPGHHAGIRHAMGFCLHNNAAVAALAAQAAGAKKVLIVDWDVHHGNGTQEIFDGNKSVLYVSLHRHEGGDFYPGTGAALEVGSMGAEGYCVNVPWSRAGVGDNDYIYAFEKVVLPIASAFTPDFTIISAGFDAARGDPLGCCDVTPAGYAEMTKMLTNVSGGKMLVILEGGYNLRSISSSATAVVKALLDEHSEEPTLVENRSPSRSGQQTVLEVLHIQKNFWPILDPSYVELESELSLFYAKKMKKLLCRKRRRILAPVLWKYGRKSILYHILTRRSKQRDNPFGRDD